MDRQRLSVDMMLDTPSSPLERIVNSLKSKNVMINDNELREECDKVRQELYERT